MSRVVLTPDFHYGEDEFHLDKYIQARLKKVAWIITPYLDEGSSVLDIGGYTADLKQYLPEFVKYHLMDFDKKALLKAEGRGIKTKQVNFDEEKMEWGGEQFDVVVCTEVLEHLKDPHRHMKEISDLVSENGVVIISLPNENTLFHRFLSLSGIGIDSMAFKLYKHLHFPTIKQSRELVSEYLSIMQEEYFIVMSGKSSKVEGISFLFSWIPDKFWLRLAYLMPSLFARGTIFLAKKRT